MPIAAPHSPIHIWTRRLGLRAVVSNLSAQAQDRFLWVPVFLATGIAAYFALPVEPDTGTRIAVFAAGLCCAALGVRARGGIARISIGLSLFLLGLSLGAWRAHQMQAPILGWPYYGVIEGRVVMLDRSASEAPRLTLDRVTMAPISPPRTPDRLRLSLHGQSVQVPQIGDIIQIEARALPPSPASEPNGFDFQRHAYFLGLGAVGYSRKDFEVIGHDPSGLWLTRARLDLSRAIQARMQAGAGGFAAAILTGDRAGLIATDVEAMRDTNIAHLLAISGLHMGLLTGFVFTALRVILALFPRVVLYYLTKKWAAVAALAAGGFYLALSGGSVATERAYIQVAVMFTAVLCDRRAISLRSVAIAALIVLIGRPETLLSPGFQMSFAATAALVVGFGALSRLFRGRTGPRSWGWRLGMAVLGVVVSSILAGAATAPFAAMHFNRLTTYGLVANLIAMPIMGILVMPLGVVAGLLAPFGLANLALYPMEQGLTLILSVAHEVAAWPRAVRMVVSPAPLVMPIFAAGFVGGLIWNGPMRAAFLLPMGVALWIWGQSPRPDILIAPSARLVGVMDEAGLRVPSHVRGEGFVVDLWLENDGDPATQPETAARPLWQAEGAGQAATVKGYRVWHGRGEAALTDALSACGAADVVILAARLNPSDSPGPCLFFDARDMAREGAVALHLPQGGIGPITIETSRASQGARLWSGRSR